MFVDNIMIVGSGSLDEWVVIAKIIKIFCVVTGLSINLSKSCLLLNGATALHKTAMEHLLQVASGPLFEGTKYLRYFIKPNGYKAGDWLWILKRFERKIKFRGWWWLTIGRHLTLAHFVLTNMIVYWFSLCNIPKAIINKIRTMTIIPFFGLAMFPCSNTTCWDGRTWLILWRKVGGVWRTCTSSPLPWGLRAYGWSSRAGACGLWSSKRSTSRTILRFSGLEGSGSREDVLMFGKVFLVPSRPSLLGWPGFLEID